MHPVRDVLLRAGEGHPATPKQLDELLDGLDDYVPDDLRRRVHDAHGDVVTRQRAEGNGPGRAAADDRFAELVADLPDPTPSTPDPAALARNVPRW